MGLKREEERSSGENIQAEEDKGGIASSQRHLQEPACAVTHHLQVFDFCFCLKHVNRLLSSTTMFLAHTAGAAATACEQTETVSSREFEVGEQRKCFYRKVFDECQLMNGLYV